MKRLASLALTLLKHFPPLGGCGRDVLTVAQVIMWLQNCRASWVQHPQFAHLQTCPDVALPFHDETWSEVLLVFQHKPGQGNRIHSYVVTDVRELPYAYAWATRTRIGDFVGVYPLPDEFACDPTQLVLYSFTHEGRARGYHARMELKRLLPPALRPLVSKYRRAARIPKAHYLSMALPCNGMKPFVVDASSKTAAVHVVSPDEYSSVAAWLKSGVQLPDWYLLRTKADLWADHLRGDKPDLYAQLAYWMGDPRNFYRAVTAQVDPNEVMKLFVRLPSAVAKKQAVQMPLF